jgi:acylphosphatase
MTSNAARISFLSPSASFARRNQNTIFDMATQRLRIIGRVQGVGFRTTLQDEAQKLGLAGWVRNRSDGSVEALAEGSPQALAALAAWARRGPSAARVTQVRVEAAPDEPGTGGFELRPTL